MKKAVVLLSGGLDSTTVLALAKADGFQVHALSFDYGQRHRIEIEAAKQVAKQLNIIEHKIMKMDLRALGGSCLTDETIEVPKDRVSLARGVEKKHTVPVTYVPARNTIFLSYALAYAEILEAFDIFYGANALDYSDYPDCRAEFKNAFENLANLATKEADGLKRFRIHAPLMQLTKAQIIQKGIEAGVDFSLTHSCYDPVDGLACGHCDSCLFRKRGFLEVKIKDPTRYKL